VKQRQPAAQRSFRVSRALCLAAPALLCLARMALAGTPQPAPSPSQAPQRQTAPAPEPPPIQPASIVAAILPEAPAAGKGRLTLAVGGNRRWCTHPDDRVAKPPSERAEPPRKGSEVFTFGYKFTISAIKRGSADTPLMLFESPVYRTASWRPAGKVGGGTGRRRRSPGPDSALSAPPTANKPRGEDPTAMVPFWQETYRCISLPERFDFDLDPGSYDVYVAFDLLNRDNSWVHRSTGYLTDIEVAEGRRTRLDGVINLGPGGQRDVDLTSATLLPDTPTPGPSGP